MLLIDVLSAACLRVHKFTLAAAISVDGDFESAGPRGVSDDFVPELSGHDFFDLLDRANGVSAVASTTAVLNLDEVRCVFVFDDLL